MFDERRREIQLELARVYTSELGRPDAALQHLREIVDGGIATENTQNPSAFEDAEKALLRLLRAGRNDIELERRLSQRLARSAPRRGHR